MGGEYSEVGVSYWGTGAGGDCYGGCIHCNEPDSQCRM